MNGTGGVPDGLTKEEWQYVLDAYAAPEQKPEWSDEVLEALLGEALDITEAEEAGEEFSPEEDWHNTKVFAGLYSEAMSRISNAEFQPIIPKLVQFFSVYRFFVSMSEKYGWNLSRPSLDPKGKQGHFNVSTPSFRLEGDDLRLFCDMMQIMDYADTDIHLDGNVTICVGKFNMFRHRTDN